MIHKEYAKMGEYELRLEWYTERWKRSIWAKEKNTIENHNRVRAWSREKELKESKEAGEAYIAGAISDEEYKRIRASDAQKRVWDEKIAVNNAKRIQVCESMIYEQDAVIAEIEDEIEKRTGRRPRKPTGRPKKSGRGPKKYDPRKRTSKNNAKRVEYVSESKKRWLKSHGYGEGEDNDE